MAQFLTTFRDYFKRRFQALKNAKYSNGGRFPGEATQDASRKRGEPGSSQEAPRRLPGGTKEAPRRHPEAPRAPQRLQEALEAIIDTTLR